MWYDEKPQPGLLIRQWQEDSHRAKNERMKVILSLLSLCRCLPDLPPLLFLVFFPFLLAPSRLSGGYNETPITRAALIPDQWPVESTGVLSAALILWHRRAPLSVCCSLSHTVEPMGNQRERSSNPQRPLERLTVVGWKSMLLGFAPEVGPLQMPKPFLCNSCGMTGGEKWDE